MNAPLLVAQRLEARALVANAVRLAFFERFGEPPNPDDRLWELDPLERLAVIGRVNGDVRQAGFTSDMVFGVAELVEYVSAVMTLLPGDVILTGTPSGVGPVQPGDVMEVEVDGIGTLVNRVVGT